MTKATPGCRASETVTRRPATTWRRPLRWPRAAGGGRRWGAGKSPGRRNGGVHSEMSRHHAEIGQAAWEGIRCRRPLSSGWRPVRSVREGRIALEFDHVMELQRSGMNDLCNLLVGSAATATLPPTGQSGASRSWLGRLTLPTPAKICYTSQCAQSIADGRASTESLLTCPGALPTCAGYVWQWPGRWTIPQLSSPISDAPRPMAPALRNDLSLTCRFQRQNIAGTAHGWHLNLLPGQSWKPNRSWRGRCF